MKWNASKNVGQVIKENIFYSIVEVLDSLMGRDLGNICAKAER
jgi:hypothetical protein